MRTELTDKARDFATEAHRGQFRRNGITPYILHPAHVVSRLAAEGESENVIAAAWLHDVLEDTQTTEIFLRSAGFPDRVIKAVVALSKRKGEDYDEYLSRVMLDAIARKVKIADILHNITDSPTQGQLSRYARALNFLVNHPGSRNPPIPE
jgi:(p)ppGpp synthase/HD superfamily hydrolase